MTDVTIVNYGLGNISAFLHIYRHLGVSCGVAESPASLVSARRIILPGVGAFDWAMEKLYRSRMRSVLDDLVLNKGVPVLGVCVGMQMMGARSEEGSSDGLGWLDAEVLRFRPVTDAKHFALPHMGWNDVYPVNSSILFQGIIEPVFYFLHSFYFAPRNRECVAAMTHYGLDFCSVASQGNVYGVQFHPEKSHGWGVQLLNNFSRA